ncbi:LOW QUALITY PROTEIN: carboxyvinyl-carboxyphosphonate phosphorylmutase, chloroplastic [Syzygium oleosum]|uniref:LOW QUALITY PROTEIN: carboxyvinyl-carboxyphosphonate phosphorylmutase, chloroplastic n=1 Tax=Syzygium oleosum TaxID=219896 RepID=UPI0024B8D450|nr:LOW QUALITY PROTEIN: carboxyvinyl-carboxyphosphonate phosphorylmutase, chloroplastic [Syzygium oleosum]
MVGNPQQVAKSTREVMKMSLVDGVCRTWFGYTCRRTACLYLVHIQSASHALSCVSFRNEKPLFCSHFFTPSRDSEMSAAIMAAHRTGLPLHYSTSRPRLPRRPANPTVGMARRTRVHRLIEDQGVVLMPGCYDALSAAIVQKAGFAAGFISGYALSASLLGKPDFGLLTPPEMAATARSVCAAAPLIPIIADADTGGGNALNVQRTVKDLIAAGAAGCFLEDQAWPKKCGHMRGKQVIPAEEHAAKIASARDAIGNSDFFLVARTDARATSAKTGLSDAIARVNLYMEAGADACFVEAPRDDDELKEIGKEIGRHTKGYRVCNMIGGGVTPLHTPKELKEMGFHLIMHLLTALYASARTVVDVLKSFKEKGTTRADLDKMATFEEFNQLVSLESWFELEPRYSNLRSAVGVNSR